MDTYKRKLTRRQVEEGMEQHDGLVHAFIRRQGGGEISYEEALQAGRMGLWRALRGYDPARGAAFSTYAWVAICRQIQQREKELKRERGSWQGELPALQAAPDPEMRVEQKLIEESLFELVGRLPQRQLRHLRPGRPGERHLGPGKGHLHGPRRSA